MRFQCCLWSLLATTHLVNVVCGACDILPDGTGPLARILQWYGKVSGASSRYGFYSPEVGDQYRARFSLQDGQGAAWFDSFEQTASLEARLRLAGSVESAFGNGEAEKSPARRQRLVQSWAAAMFTRHPSAVSLTIVVEAYDVPTRAEYRAGLRPTWKVVYQAQVQRDSSAAQERIAP